MMKRVIEFYPAYDHRAKGQGVGGVRIEFRLEGEEGAVVVHLLTDWVLDETRDWWRTLPPVLGGAGHAAIFGPCCAHSRSPRDGFAAMGVPCPYTGGAECWCADAGMLVMDPAWQAMREHGGDAF
jgi:hypothetical protein